MPLTPTTAEIPEPEEPAAGESTRLRDGLLTLGARWGIPFAGLYALSGLIAVVVSDAETIALIYAIGVILICGLALGRTAIHVHGHTEGGKRHGYLCRPSHIADPGERSIRRKLNWSVALNTASVVLGLAGAIALLCHPGAPIACMLVPVIPLAAIYWGTAAVTAHYVDLIDDLQSGTEIVDGSPFGELIDKVGDAEWGADGQVSFTPLKPVLDFFRAGARRGRSSALVVALSLGLASIAMVNAFAHLNHARFETVKKIANEHLGEPGEDEREEPDTPLDEDSQIVEHPSARREDCDPNNAGAGAPHPYSSHLHGLWNGRHKQPGLDAIPGEGFDEAGCPRRQAWRASADPDVWVQPGHCGAELRGFAVAAFGYDPAMLFQRAAEFASRMAIEGRLVGAYGRVAINAGDAVVIDVMLSAQLKGSYVLARSRSTAARPDGLAPAQASACGPLEDGNVRYVVVPPGLLPLWRQVVIEKGWAWPDDGGATFSKRGEFAFRDPHGRKIASASCMSEVDCAASIDGRSYTTGTAVGSNLLVTQPEEFEELETLSTATD
jgi:hypothetical protein